ncbi:glucuronate isomerase [Vibrio rumoiensis]|uniref:glucuronate isomerase n=1 Tax=Vibrio rumoiensis TaxID=76258 RepID=UPI000B5C5A4D|nr:glucuronate isomerase [Vibrio rumoiensis]
MTNPGYISDTFLLESPLAQQLYQSYASHLPIIDFHTHLEARDIYYDRSYSSITEAWLSSDHYLWRAMRSVGIDEYFITGDASEYEKFSQWCEAMPFLIGSPLYQWCHLELKRFFQLDQLLCPENCQTIWQHCNQKLKSGELSARQILIQNKVDALCTTDDPLSDLQFHRLLAEEQFPVKVLPTFRADGLINTQNPLQFNLTINKLAEITKTPINDWHSFQHALKQRIEFFHAHGCRLSDVGINQLDAIEQPSHRTEHLFELILKEQDLTLTQQQQLSADIFHYLAEQYHQRNWAMQVHLGVMPNVNKRRLTTVGVGTGFSIMHDSQVTRALAERLSRLDNTNQLPKTVLYNLNPKDTWPLASLIGAFQDSDSAAGKIQLGAAWWFNDHKHGMIQQMTALANLGSLGRFIGMLTDSRSALSLSRHEYFRRVLCDLLAKWAISGEIPNHQPLLKQTIDNICYHNAKQYFDF